MYTLVYVSGLISTLTHFACLVSAIPLSYTQTPTPSKVGSYCLFSHFEECVCTQADVPTHFAGHAVSLSQLLGPV